jgi:hypothetical protein
MSNVIQILLVSPAKTGTAKASGKPYSIVETHCMLLNEDGTTAGVGTFILPRDVPQDIKAGYYAPAYSLVAASYGDRKGDIVPQITGLTPLSESAIRRLRAGPDTATLKAPAAV